MHVDVVTDFVYFVVKQTNEIVLRPTKILFCVFLGKITKRLTIRSELQQLIDETLGSETNALKDSDDDDETEEDKREAARYIRITGTSSKAHDSTEDECFSPSNGNGAVFRETTV